MLADRVSRLHRDATRRNEERRAAAIAQAREAAEEAERAAGLARERKARVWEIIQRTNPEMAGFLTAMHGAFGKPAEIKIETPETGRVTILRYTVAQDAGKAIHPSYVEGQFQGGAAQGVGWALNEEYIYGADGKLQNAGFLDYRMPVASDLPMIDAIIVEVPNPRHPYGVRGIGETPIVPPMAAIANAIEQATGIRFTELPMSPPKILKALKARGLNHPGNGGSAKP
jgi:CO/xanthine dehydrogenase Mo-binding subunit